jgi:hypothetical protein
MASSASSAPIAVASERQEIPAPEKKLSLRRRVAIILALDIALWLVLGGAGYGVYALLN